MEKAQSGLPIMPHRKQPHKTDIYSEYKEMVAKVRAEPQSISYFGNLFNKILHSIAESKGELQISNVERWIYFARDGIPLTDFAAIPLIVIRRYSVDGVEDYVELLILGKGVLPKIVTICAKDLSSAQWIENLGIGYIYEKKRNLEY